ncbi:hypothetical protein HK104_002023 [Borealophlyctis nickersoniae]|nr:hypothetical protein HK104_002023 [Borealophlyctis nickersoniae]
MHRSKVVDRRSDVRFWTTSHLAEDYHADYRRWGPDSFLLDKQFMKINRDIDGGLPAQYSPFLLNAIKAPLAAAADEENEPPRVVTQTQRTVTYDDPDDPNGGVEVEFSGDSDNSDLDCDGGTITTITWTQSVTIREDGNGHQTAVATELEHKMSQTFDAQGTETDITARRGDVKGADAKAPITRRHSNVVKLVKQRSLTLKLGDEKVADPRLEQFVGTLMRAAKKNGGDLRVEWD